MPGYFPTRPSVHLSDYKRRGPSQPQGAVWSLSKTPLSLLTFLLAARPKTLALVVLFTSRHVHRGRTRVVLVPGVLVDEVRLIIIVVYLFLTLALARARAAVTSVSVLPCRVKQEARKAIAGKLMNEQRCIATEGSYRGRSHRSRDKRLDTLAFWFHQILGLLHCFSVFGLLPGSILLGLAGRNANSHEISHGYINALAPAIFPDAVLKRRKVEFELFDVSVDHPFVANKNTPSPSVSY